MEKWPDLIDEAQRLALEVPYVESEAIEAPKLTGDLYIDVVQQAGLSTASINVLARRLDLKLEELCHQLVGLADQIGGGLDPKAKGKWILHHLEAGQSLFEIHSLLDDMKDSPST